MKERTKYVCGECGHESIRWTGRCDQCGAWDSMREVSAAGPAKEADIHRRRRAAAVAALRQDRTGRDGLGSDGFRSSGFGPDGSGRGGPRLIGSVERLQMQRLDLGLAELNRVLGGGLVPGSLVLLAGDPGIGKSTLLLQAASRAASAGAQTWYITGEESEQQVKLRAERMDCVSENLWLWAQTDIEEILARAQSSRPDLVIVDSIQTMYAPDLDAGPGSVAQIRECSARLGLLARAGHLPVMLVGHVTKDGNIAGPMLLEHMVDTVLYFEGERHYPYRLLRTMKNRFGPTFEIGVFAMGEEGLTEVLNPSMAFLSDRPTAAPGSAVAACMEGSRPLLAEVQALLSPSGFTQPRRVVTGVDYNRVNMLLAVLEKRAGLKLGNQDAFVNIAGGIRLQEPAMDLAIAAAIASSFKNRALRDKTALMGEVGLAGEVRPVTWPDKRAQEAEKLGMRTLLAPKGTKEKIGKPSIEILEAGTLIELLDMAML